MVRLRTVPLEIVDGIIADLKDSWDTSPSTPDFFNAHRITDAWRRSKHVRQLATWQPALDILSELYDREPMPFQTINFVVGSQQPAPMVGATPPSWVWPNASRLPACATKLPSAYCAPSETTITQ